MKKIVITGILGFLGRYIARAWSEYEAAIYGVDQIPISDNDRAALHVYNYSLLKLPSHDFERLVASVQPDYVIHTAGPSSVQRSIEDPKADFEGAVPVVAHILDSLRRLAPDCKLMFLSSGAVYGNPSELPVKENSLLKPISPYGFHKLQCENLLAEFNLIYDMRCCSLRIFSAYGEGLKRQLLWDICRKAASKGVVELFGTGKETRDFIHASDIAKAIKIVARGAEFRAEAYNLASGSETAVSAVARGLVSSLDRDIPIVFKGEQRAGDPSNWRADITRIINLGFRPGIKIDEGLTAYARWFLAEA